MRDDINLFYDLAAVAKDASEFEYSFAMEGTGSMINNLGHGVPRKEWIPKVLKAISWNLERDDISDEEKRGWVDAVKFLDHELSFL